MTRSPSRLAAALATAALAFLAPAGPAGAFSYYDGHTAPVPDWQVFGFDLTTVPGDIPSLMAFKASLDPRLQLAVNNRCKEDIVAMPWRYSPKIRMFCWGH